MNGGRIRLDQSMSNRAGDYYLFGVGIWFLSVLAMTGPLPPVQAFDEGVNLQPQWYEGQQSRYEFWNFRQQSTTMELGGQQRRMDNTMESEGEITWRVDKVRADGSASCTMVLDWMCITITGPEGDEQYNDSRQGSGDTEPLHQLLKAMAGVALTVAVDSDGTISGVDGVEVMARGVDEPLIVPDELNFMESASDLASLPGAPSLVEQGDAWKQQFRWDHDMGFMNYSTTFTLDTVEQIEGIPIATVSSRSKLKLDFDDSELPPGSPPVDVRLVEGRQESQVIFDLNRHEAVGRNTSEHQTINMSVRLPQHTFTRLIEQDMQGQVLRISEQ